MEMKYSIIQLLTIVLLAGAVSLLKNRLLLRLQKKIDASHNVWGKAFLNSIRKPLRFFIWFTMFALALRFVQQMFLQDEPTELLSILYKSGVLFIFMWAVFRFINKFEALAALIENNKYNAVRIAQLLRVSSLVIGGICFLQLLEIPLSGLLAFGGVGGIAIGFAAKDLFANFFGGFMIFLDQPFKIGDWIRSPNQEIEGIVEHIGWRLTRIRTLNKSLIFVPNTVFSTIVVDNPSQMSHRQIKTKLILSHADQSKVHQIISEIWDYLRVHPEIDAKLPSFVNLISLSPLGLEVAIQVYTKTVDLLEYQAVQQELFLKILAIVESHGAHLADMNRSISSNQVNVGYLSEK